MRVVQAQAAWRGVRGTLVAALWLLGLAGCAADPGEALSPDVAVVSPVADDAATPVVEDLAAAPRADAAAAAANPTAPPPLSPDGPQTLPVASQPCPEIREGDRVFLGKKVRVWVAPGAAARAGPLVFYWHGTGSGPLEALVGLGLKAIDAIKAQGGLVVGPQGPTGLGGTMTGGVVWSSGDLALADEILACAVQQVGVDTRRVHSTGMSAGALHTTIMSYSRAGYLASVASFSGGLVPILPPPPSQNPANKLPALIVHGGTKDQLNWFSFKESSERYRDALRAAGHYALLCDHGLGHTIPPNGGPGAWRFFQDHPWRVSPEPYQPGQSPALVGTCAAQ